MRINTTVTAGLVACALAIGAAPARAADFDTTMQAILVDYLKIQEALAADKTEGIENAIQAIQSSATKLHPEHVEGEHADHYRNLSDDLLAACEEFHGAEDIAAMRRAFKDLSKPVSMWVSMAKPEHVNVMYCPMQKAGWVQRGSEVSNPYFGKEMGSCGHVVGGNGH